jgi:FADH2 O2-dependent halogenase
MNFDVDIAIVGAGFGGSLTAMVMQRLGLRAILLDRGSHPRFAIGESSTPIGNLVLRDIARRYDLPRLEPLTKYGPWQATYPEIVGGLKRGFSYFFHYPGQKFHANSSHSTELLVAASSNDFEGDTHWLRADVDQFLAQEAVAAGVPYLDQAVVTLQHEPGDGGWTITGHRQNEPLLIRAKFLVDATGEAAVLPKTLGISCDAEGMRTMSRGLFAHFAGVTPWHQLLQQQGDDLSDHPFCCDDAALHHLLNIGWMWQLRFNNGITSVGFAIDMRRRPLDSNRTPQDEWAEFVARFPALQRQLADATVVQPPGGLRRSGRMQRRAARSAGADWALLPNTAGFVDPLHSTGIAQTLCGIERLGHIFATHWGRSTLADELQTYERTLQLELDLIDELVHNCYIARHYFSLFTSATMLYFAMAVAYEQRRIQGQMQPGAAFLCADDPEKRAVVAALSTQLAECVRPPGDEEAAKFPQRVAKAIAPFNYAGLCDPRVKNMYRRTAVDESQQNHDRRISV